MAKVAILIEDIENDGISVNVSTDTDVEENGSLTTAQTLGALTVQYLQSMISMDTPAEAEAEVAAVDSEAKQLSLDTETDDEVQPMTADKALELGIVKYVEEAEDASEDAPVAEE